MAQDDHNSSDDKQAQQSAVNLSMGIGVGLALGAGIGLVRDNLALGVGIGLALGAVFGGGFTAIKGMGKRDGE